MCLKCAALTADLELERRLNEALIRRLTLAELEAIYAEIPARADDQ